MSEITSDELAARMRQVWLDCTKDSTKPDLILSRPFTAWKGNWWRVICHFAGHDWQPMKFVNVTHMCDRCGATQVQPMEEFPPIDRTVIDWWRNKT